MTDLQQQLWDWQEAIDSPAAAKLLLVRAIQRLGVLEEVLVAARDAYRFHAYDGTSAAHDLAIDTLGMAIELVDASKSTKSGPPNADVPHDF